MRFVAGQGAGAQNHREANPAQVHQIACQGAVAESYREDVAGQGATAESHREYVAGQGAAAESLCGRGCRSAEADAAPTEELAAAAAKHSVAPSGSTCEQGEAMRTGISNAGYL